MRKWHIIKRSLGISAVVGTILNAVNQGGAFFEGEPINWTHFVMNYLVPFLVASYSAWANERARRRSSPAPTNPDSS